MSPSRPPTSRRLPERTSRNRARQIPCTPALPASAIVCRFIRDDRVEASPALPSARLRAPGSQLSHLAQAAGSAAVRLRRLVRRAYGHGLLQGYTLVEADEP